MGLTDRAVHWFLKSGILQPSGGVARYYHAGTRTFHAVSTEITGYVAATLAYLHRLTGETDCLEAAVRAGRFLTRVAWDPALGTIPYECRPENDSRRPPSLLLRRRDHRARPDDAFTRYGRQGIPRYGGGLRALDGG